MSHWRVKVYPPDSVPGGLPRTVLIESALAFHAAKYAVLQTHGPDGVYKVVVTTLRGRRQWHYHVDVETTRVARVQ